MVGPDNRLSRVLWNGQVVAVFRTAAVVLALVVLALLLIWQPWIPRVAGSARTISVTGTATITATPDQYVFSPNYDFNEGDKTAALNALTTKSDQIVAKLKVLGVASKDIKANANGYTSYGYYLPPNAGNDTYTLYLTVTVNDPKLAQKVQDYLVTTDPSGAVTPTVSFSTSMQHKLQSQARIKAEQDARSQADQSARNLGFSVGAVKTVTDNNGGGIFPLVYGGTTSGADTSAPKSLILQSGQNDLSYSVTVVYYIQ